MEEAACGQIYGTDRSRLMDWKQLKDVCESGFSVCAHQIILIPFDYRHHKKQDLASGIEKKKRKPTFFLLATRGRYLCLHLDFIK